jgi:hypothetical protein
MVVMSAVAALAATPLWAQETPNFSGTWTVAADAMAQGRAAGRATAPDGAPARGARGGDRAARAGGGGGRAMALIGIGRQATITQDGATLTIARATQTGEIKTVYKLDGSDSPNTISGPNGNSIEQVSRAKWDGSKLSITTSMTAAGNPVETTLTLSLDASGALVVETSGMGRAGGGRSMTLKYTKG